MEENLKQLLLKDLCARLPYGVKVKTPYNDAILRGIVDRKGVKTTIDYTDIVTDKQTYPIRYIKPYLRSMSSMTEKEMEEYKGTFVELPNEEYLVRTIRTIDWLNAHHFDYRGLIEKNLALDCIYMINS